MQGKNRPYLTYSIFELFELAKNNRNSKNKLDLILSELSVRRMSKYLKILRNQISVYLASIPKKPYTITKSNIMIGTHTYKFAGNEQSGILARLGYKVGHNGMSISNRRDILDFAFNNELPPTTSPEYMEEWGTRLSAKRLKKLANCLSTFAANAKNHSGGDYSVAIKHWRDDLKYLRNEYYEGKFNFKWPSDGSD